MSIGPHGDAVASSLRGKCSVCGGVLLRRSQQFTVLHKAVKLRLRYLQLHIDIPLVANPSWDLFVGHGRGVSDSPSHLGRCP